MNNVLNFHNVLTVIYITTQLTLITYCMTIAFTNL